MKSIGNAYKLQKRCRAALLVSLLPLATLFPVFFKVALPDGMRHIWAIFNIGSALTGLTLSAVFVKRAEGRNAVSILALIVSAALVLLMLGITALALVLNLRLS